MDFLQYLGDPELFDAVWGNEMKKIDAHAIHWRSLCAACKEVVSSCLCQKAEVVDQLVDPGYCPYWGTGVAGHPFEEARSEYEGEGYVKKQDFDYQGLTPEQRERVRRAINPESDYGSSISEVSAVDKLRNWKEEADYLEKQRKELQDRENELRERINKATGKSKKDRFAARAAEMSRSPSIDAYENNYEPNPYERTWFDVPERKRKARAKPVVEERKVIRKITVEDLPE